MEVARAQGEFFPNVAVEATAAAVAYYQQLGTWTGDITIEPGLYETSLDVFEHSKLITRRHPYENIVVAPPKA